MKPIRRYLTQEKDQESSDRLQLSGMEDGMRKEKEEKESRNSQLKDDLTIFITDQPLPVSAVVAHQQNGSSLPVQQPSFRSPDLILMSLTPSSDPPLFLGSSENAPSSLSGEIELVQAATKLRLTQASKQETPPSYARPSFGTRIPISSIPPASERPLFVPRSGRPPRQAQRISYAEEARCPINVARLWMLKPRERARFKLTCQRRARKRERGLGRAPFTIQSPSGPSPIGSGSPPYEMVKTVLSELKQHLNQLALAESLEKSQQPPSLPPPPAHPAASSSSHPIAPAPPSSEMEVDKVTSSSSQTPLSVEEVIHRLDDYLSTIPRTASEDEMVELLLEFQRRVGVEPWPCWYDLMEDSFMEFFDSMLGYFVCETLESDDEDDDWIY